jgi:hypothetical protein
MPVQFTERTQQKQKKYWKLYNQNWELKLVEELKQKNTETVSQSERSYGKQC